MPTRSWIWLLLRSLYRHAFSRQKWSRVQDLAGDLPWIKFPSDLPANYTIFLIFFFDNWFWLLWCYSLRTNKQLLHPYPPVSHVCFSSHHVIYRYLLIISHLNRHGRFRNITICMKVLLSNSNLVNKVFEILFKAWFLGIGTGIWFE